MNRFTRMRARWRAKSLEARVREDDRYKCLLNEVNRYGDMQSHLLGGPPGKEAAFEEFTPKYLATTSRALEALIRMAMGDENFKLPPEFESAVRFNLMKELIERYYGGASAIWSLFGRFDIVEKLRYKCEKTLEVYANTLQARV